MTEENDELAQLVADVHKLNDMTGRDYERDHAEADEILLRHVPHRLRLAYRRLQNRARRWPTA